jgi:uncharacterized Zn-binding protein involved in type VI secretion
MGQPAARLGDTVVCPLVTYSACTQATIIRGCFTVLIGNQPAARMTDNTICSGTGLSGVVIKGSPTVLIQNLPAARMGDQAAHGGTIVKGEFTVLIGLRRRPRLRQVKDGRLSELVLFQH